MFTQFGQSLSRGAVIDTVHRFNATTNVIEMFELLMHIIEKLLFLHFPRYRGNIL